VNAPALLIAAHGTRDAAGVREALAMLQLVKSAAPDIAVECGFLELASPGIPNAVDALVASGARDIVVFPSMLFAAGHTKSDIPSAIALQRLRYPDVRLRYARNFGIDGDLLAMVEQRIDEVVAVGDRERTGVLLVGRGSSDPDANSDLFKIARLLHEGRPYPFVEVSFSGIARPFVPEGLERCRRLGAERLVVVPYFLFTGILPERIKAQSAVFAREHPEIQVTMARHLWPDIRLAALVLARYREGIGTNSIDFPLPPIVPAGDDHQHGAHHTHAAGAQGARHGS
jgi:sirohydrochlorin ferrochelatase